MTTSDIAPEPAGTPGQPVAPRSGMLWRGLLALAVVVLTLIGSGFWTDDAWPFAPFRMFSVAVKPDGRVVKVAFQGETRSGRRLDLDAEAFGLRRAEVEGQQGTGGRLGTDQMVALAASYNREHPDDPLVRLDFKRLGRTLVDGEPTGTIDDVIQTWAVPVVRSDEP